MKRSFALAAACIGALMLGATPTLANDAGVKASFPSAPALTADYESSFVATQGRRGGRGIRGGGGRGVVVVGPRRRNNFGRNVGIGVGAAVLGGIIASQAVQARGGGGQCRSWAINCDRGYGWACRSYNRYC